MSLLKNNFFSIKTLITITITILVMSINVNATLVKYHFENKSFDKNHYIITDKNQDFIIYKNDKYIEVNESTVPIHLYSIDKKLKKGSYYFIKNTSILFQGENIVNFNLQNTLTTYIIDSLGYKDIEKIGIDKVRLIIKENLSTYIDKLKLTEEDFLIRTNLSTYYINNEVRRKLLPIILETAADIDEFKRDIESFENNHNQLDYLTPINIEMYKKEWI